MELTYSEKKLIVAIVAQELADIDLKESTYVTWEAVLAHGARKLAYWLGDTVPVWALDEAQEALCNLARCADGTDLSWEFGMPVYESERESLRESFDDAYETAVINIIGINTEVM